MMISWVLWASSLAAPAIVQSVGYSSKIQIVGQEVNDIGFYPPSSSIHFPISNQRLLKRSSDDQIIQIAKNALVKSFDLSIEEIKITQLNYDKESGLAHIYCTRIVNEVLVDNNNCAVHILNEQVISISSSFNGSLQKRSTIVSPKITKLTADKVISMVSKQIGVPRDNYPIKMVYLQSSTGQLVYCYQFQLRTKNYSFMYQVSADATTGKIIQLIDYVKGFSYKAVPLPKNDPRYVFETIAEPTNVSPLGWHNDGNQTYLDTQGNNVDANINGTRVAADANAHFESLFTATGEALTNENKRSAIINAFYLVNTIHDISYLFGFDEAAGNFQNNNFGKGGDGNDRVIVECAPEEINSAFFVTPPDGQNGFMSLSLWNITVPNRYGALDNSIGLHEYTHGITNRLTGGSRQANCMYLNESRGLDEGWADTVSMFLERKPVHLPTQNFTISNYVVKNIGIRSVPYTTDMKFNSLTYGSGTTRVGVHAIGEIWASILNEVYWNLVSKRGFTTNWYDVTQTHGNIVALKNLITGLKLQPCNPTFITARDAFIHADQLQYNGDNFCEIWKGFAKRGLGVDALPNYVNGFQLPANCTTSTTTTSSSTTTLLSSLIPTTVSNVPTVVADTTTTSLAITTTTDNSYSTTLVSN
ncbi:hypothetical protein HDV02_001891 [Globomyces sp. JEL0801]|nr:hypothetical protein HDV02_001891 [Globomyces sp. JEL0801]